MEHITVWIKQIVAVIIIAGFLEMILPDNQLKGVTKLIMGLLVISMMIRPITALYHLPANYAGRFDNVMVDSSNDFKTQTLIERGVKLRGEWNRAFNREYEEVAVKKINKALNAAGLSYPLRLRWEYEEDTVKKVVLTITQPKGNQSKPGKTETEQVVRMVSAVTDLKEKQIEVIWRVANQ